MIKFSFLFLPAIFLLSSVCVANEADKAPGQGYKIYVLHSYSEELSGVLENNKGLFSAFDGEGGIKGRYQAKSLYMDSKRNNSEEYLISISSRALAEIAYFKPDVLITVDDAAALHVGKRLLGSPLPVVMCDINGDPVEDGLVKSYQSPGFNITGVIERQNYAAIYKLARRLTPPVKKICFISDDSEIARIEVRDFLRVFRDISIPAEKYLSNSWEGWKTAIMQNQKAGTIIIPFLFYTLKDGSGRTIPQDEVIAWLLANSKVPEYGGTSFQVKDGFLASVSTHNEAQGYEAALLAMRILRGESPADMPIMLPQVGSIDINMERAKMLKVKVPFDLLSSATIYPIAEALKRIRK